MNIAVLKVILIKPRVNTI